MPLGRRGREGGDREREDALATQPASPQNAWNSPPPPLGSWCTGAMQPRMLLIVALVALLASARADEGEGSLLLGSMQGYMEQASKTVQDALSSMQESDIAVVARGWMDNRFKSLKGYWSKFTDKFTGLWESSPEDQLTTPTLEP
ncbi:apolipoprotein C-III isoform X1 [Rattus rattus]|uniref:apolipoprotein C-III isoform X1 n=2 Tax=Rattus rattus TaxID=10117 RepID=UPI0013F2E81B|nr:apolipoprotein C-III isoform X1 [Rattus rattus]